MRAGGAAAFLNLPAAFGALRATLYKTAQEPGTISQKFGDVSGAASDGLDGALVHMVQDIAPALTLLTGAIAFISGLFLICSGLLAMSNIGFGQENTTKKQIAARLAVGTMLTSFATSINTILASIFGTTGATSSAALAYNTSALDAATNAQVTGLLNAIFMWLALIGIIAILRGLWILKDLLEKGGGLTAPLTHLIAGGMLVNMGPTVHLIEKTLDVPGIT